MEWPFDVIDEMTGPLKAMEKSLGVFDTELSKVEKSLHQMELQNRLAAAAAEKDPFKQKLAFLRIYNSELQRTAAVTPPVVQETQGFFESLMEADVLEKAAHMAKELGEKLLELGSEFIRTGTEMADFRNGALLSIGAITGNDEAAGDYLEHLEAMSKGTKMTGEQMVAQFQDLGAFFKRFGNNAGEQLIAGIEDVRVVYRDAGADAVKQAIKNMEAMGHMDERALRGLKESGVAGPDIVKHFLADRMHKSVAQIDAMLKAGKIDAATGTQAILDLIRTNIDKGQLLGSMSVKGASGSVGVQVKNFKDSIKELFEKVDTKPLTDALSKLGALFDPGTKRGQQLEAVINRLFKAFGDLVSWATEGDRLANVFDKVGQYAVMAWPFIKGVGYALAAVGAAAAAITAVIVAPFVLGSAATLYLIGSLDKVWEKTKGFGSEMLSIGKNIVQGLIDGIMSMVTALEASVKNIKDKIVNGLKGHFDMHSPSKVMAELGENVSLGFSMGVAKPPSPSLAGMSDIMLPTPKFANLAGGGGGAGPRHFQGGDINVDVHVAGAGGDPNNHNALGEQIAQKVQEQVQLAVRSEIVRFMEDDSIAN